jgi:hypothetical protein
MVFLMVLSIRQMMSYVARSNWQRVVYNDLVERLAVYDSNRVSRENQKQ